MKVVEINKELLIKGRRKLSLHGNQTAAAAAMQVHPNTIYRIVTLKINTATVEVAAKFEDYVQTL